MSYRSTSDRACSLTLERGANFWHLQMPSVGWFESLWFKLGQLREFSQKNARALAGVEPPVPDARIEVEQ